MSAAKFVSLGKGRVERTTGKAALVKLESDGYTIDHWIAFSVMNDDTRAKIEPFILNGARIVIVDVGVVDWFPERANIKVPV